MIEPFLIRYSQDFGRLAAVQLPFSAVSMPLDQLTFLLSCVIPLVIRSGLTSVLTRGIPRDPVIWKFPTCLYIFYIRSLTRIT